MSEMNEAFDGLNKKFDTTFDSVEELNKQMETLKNKLVVSEEKKAQLATSEDRQNIIDDQEYLREELKNTITNAKLVMKKLEADIKIGSNPRAHEVYATLVRSVTESIRELRELNTSVVDLKIKGVAVGKSNGSNKISLTPNQLADMMDRIRSQNQFNAIEADFTVDEKEDLK